jgi:hypothetical protein
MRYGIPQGWKFQDIVGEAQRARNSRRGAITHLSMNGWNEGHTSKRTQTITPAVRKHFENQNLDCFSLMPIPEGHQEIDHRYGNKEHPDYIEIYQPGTQKPEHFQVDYDVLNSVKRQM